MSFCRQDRKLEHDAYSDAPRQPRCGPVMAPRRPRLSVTPAEPLGGPPRSLEATDAPVDDGTAQPATHRRPAFTRPSVRRRVPLAQAAATGRRPAQGSLSSGPRDERSGIGRPRNNRRTVSLGVLYDLFQGSRSACAVAWRSCSPVTGSSPSSTRRPQHLLLGPGPRHATARMEG
jgi:hypothetical protein